MQNEFDDPYAPTNPTEQFSFSETELGIPKADLKRAKAVVKDADQFWLAILLCFLCVALAPFLIGPWYLSRRLAWQSLGTKYPVLMDSSAPPNTFPGRFQRANTKLFIAFAFGGVMLGIMVLAFGICFRRR